MELITVPVLKNRSCLETAAGLTFLHEKPAVLYPVSFPTDDGIARMFSLNTSIPISPLLPQILCMKGNHRNAANNWSSDVRMEFQSLSRFLLQASVPKRPNCRETFPDLYDACEAVGFCGQ